MNDQQFIELRERARDAGMSVPLLITRAGSLPSWCQLEYPGPNELIRSYREYKDKHFGRLYNSGQITAAVAEKRRVAAADALAAGYGGTVTGRMTSTMPSYSNIPKKLDTGALEDLYQHMKKLMYEQAALSPMPPLVISRQQADDIRKYCTFDVETTGPLADSIYGMPIHILKEPITMNKTSDYGQATGGASYLSAEALREQLAAAEAREAAEQAAIERDLYLASLSNLASQTERLINAVRFPSNNRLAFGKAHLKALKALADELGAKIQPTNDAGYFTVLVAA